MEPFHLDQKREQKEDYESVNLLLSQHDELIDDECLFLISKQQLNLQQY